MSQTNHHEIETPRLAPHGDAPATDDDLTIADYVEIMRVEGETRPGEQCFLNERGEKRWVAESEVKRFIRRLGALHPSDYQAANGSAWTLNFFSGF
jgi:hypothetical protein